MLRESNTEELICNKMIELMQDKPCLNIKVTELVKYANISRSSFYIYFNSIFDVLQKIEDDFIEGLRDENSIPLGSFIEGHYDGLLSTLNYIKENMHIYRTLCGPNGDPSFQARLANRSAKIFDKIFESTSTKLNEVEKKLISENVSGGRWSMYKWWAFHEDEISVDQMASFTKKIINQVFDLL